MALFDRIRLLFNQQLQENNIELITEVHQTKNLNGDPQLVEQVLINLVKNALEAMADQIKPQIILKSFHDKDQKTVISVSDNGAGIPVKNLEEIFVPFFTTKEEGSGIGLNVSRQIMRLHKGEIFVTSEEGKGTVVSLVF
jgi:signal transduction histidine kinase